VRSVALGAVLVSLSCLGLSGCTGFSRGVTEAIIGRGEQAGVDVRQCHARGPSFEGLDASMRRQDEIPIGDPRSSLKVLMVHGIGDHIPGYATRLGENLARSLGLGRTERRFKQFSLIPDQETVVDLGVLRVTRFTDAEAVRELLFYELTWDPIVEEEKQTLAFDSSPEYAFRRTAINNAMKSFVNATVPDVLMYQGTSKEAILASVAVSMCWMFSHDWQTLPNGSDPQHCGLDHPRYLGYLEDDYAFITHSLGSRIVTDALQALPDNADRAPPVTQERLGNIFRRRLPVFMLSNQLPLLQLGQPPLEVSGQIDTLCTEEFDPSSGRFYQEIALVAFSDPNDVMSYPIPQGYVDEHVDSRMCPSLVNVVLNIAEPISIFGTRLADPLTAHSGYEDDPRVIGMITHGLGNEWVAPIVSERCEWLETP